MNLHLVPIEQLDFSNRARLAAAELGATTLADLDKIGDHRLMRVPGVGATVVREIRDAIRDYRSKPDTPESIDPQLLEEVARAITTMGLIDKLRQEEGATVQLGSDNADFNDLPNCLVTVFGSQTDWDAKEYRADTVIDCLRMAVRDLDIYRFTQIVG